MTELSTDALVFGYGHFARKGSTLSFGGDHAEMMITPRARAALDELIKAGFVVKNEPQDQWPNREHYIAAKSVAPELAGREDLNPFSEECRHRFEWSTFVKKEASGGE